MLHIDSCAWGWELILFGETSVQILGFLFKICYLFERQRMRTEGRREIFSHMAATTRVGLGRKQEADESSGSPMWVQESTHEDRLLQLSQAR